MRGPFAQQRRNNEQEIEKTPLLVVQKIRDAILDENFKPGERLPEDQLGKMFNVSRNLPGKRFLRSKKRARWLWSPIRGLF
jgi:DNA-binding FadR family transcriptional regulator